jgi:hypothetical protein
MKFLRAGSQDWESRLPDDWISEFCGLLEKAEERAQSRKNIIDNLTVSKLAGFPRKEVEMAVFAELMVTGQVPYAPLYQIYLDEVYGSEVKETTS